MTVEVGAGPVDGPADRWRQRDLNHLGALAAYAQHSVAVFFAQVGDVCTSGFEDSLDSSMPARGAIYALILVLSAPVSSRHSMGAASSPSRAMSTTGRGVKAPPLAAGSPRKANLIAGPRR